MKGDNGNLVIPMEAIREEHRELVGSKAFSLHALVREGLRVPPYLCITTTAYENYLSSSGLKGRIILELSRKKIEDMRWEEMWDTSLRIRNMFLTTPVPDALDREIEGNIDERFKNVPVVVRSSAPGEDSGETSFAGLHESYVNIRGIQAIMEHIRLVWASLWSDAALLYRKELGLDIEDSKMAVLVQELVAGEVSGIVFSSDPGNSDQMVVEAVHGLNKGLVDGDVEPDRWTLERVNSVILEHVSPSNRERIVKLKENGTTLEPSDPETSATIPLQERDLHELHDIAMSLERIHGSPQDIEWTKKNRNINILQSRPITTTVDKEKLWYLSLRRTMDDLEDLHKRVEYELIPEMIKDAEDLGSVNMDIMDNRELASEVRRRRELYDTWHKRYYDEFIPFAHGMRLFGQVYNDVVKPSDPYEFMELLSGSGLLSIKRNKELKRLSGMVRNDNSLIGSSGTNDIADDLRKEFRKAFDIFFEEFGHSGVFRDKKDLMKLIIEIASGPEKEMPFKDNVSDLQERFIASFGKKDRDFAHKLLEIGRISYRLRDDDNIHLGRIEDQYIRSLKEAKRRIAARIASSNVPGKVDVVEADELLKALDNDEYIPSIKENIKEKLTDEKVHNRQIQGQPAGEGLVTGIAHVITENDDLFNVRYGEILVCDAIDPNMTFVVPLVSGIVERRGGMLIHGAIIAREYGIPCVTGIPEATHVIGDGDEITVDGYLGIVTIKRK